MVTFTQKARTRQEREAEFKRISDLARAIIGRIASSRMDDRTYDVLEVKEIGRDKPGPGHERDGRHDGDHGGHENLDVEWLEEGVQYFWLSTNPTFWSANAMKEGKEEFFPAVNPKGFKRRLYTSFLKAKPGDRVIFYESPPVNKVVATGEVTRELHVEYSPDMGKEVEGISLKYVDPVSCVIWETIAGIRDLQSSAPVVNMAHGSLFPLTEEEYGTILSLDEFHSCTLPEDTFGMGTRPSLTPEERSLLSSGAPEERPYVETGLEPGFGRSLDRLGIGGFNDDPEVLSRDISLKTLYFEDGEAILRQICSALANGKHIILYGPPGTGKSKLAQEICNLYQVPYNMVTATSDWSTFDTIGGYVPEAGGRLRFNPGIFLKSLKQDDIPVNHWLIIDEINRAEIDKAFGSLFSALTGDNITLPQKIQGHHVEIRGRSDPAEKVLPHKYFIHPDWRIIATMNTLDKASLYEMSYAFMRRFSFIPVGLPEDLDTAMRGLIAIWGLEVDEETITTMVTLWTIINRARKVGPAIIEDILRYILKGRDYTSALIIHALPQFEGLDEDVLRAFRDDLRAELGAMIDDRQLRVRMEDFFDMKF